MNRRQVVIEYEFVVLKNRWKILTNFPNDLDKATRKTLVCYVFHNFCEMRKLPLPISIST